MYPVLIIFALTIVFIVFLGGRYRRALKKVKSGPHLLNSQFQDPANIYYLELTKDSSHVQFKEAYLIKSLQDKEIGKIQINYGKEVNIIESQSKEVECFHPSWGSIYRTDETGRERKMTELRDKASKEILLYLLKSNFKGFTFSLREKEYRLGFKKGFSIAPALIVTLDQQVLCECHQFGPFEGIFYFDSGLSKDLSPLDLSLIVYSCFIRF